MKDKFRVPVVRKKKTKPKSALLKKMLAAAKRRPVPRRGRGRVIPTKLKSGLLTASSVMIPSTHGKRASPQVAKAIRMTGAPNIHLNQVAETFQALVQYQALFSLPHLPVTELLAIRGHVSSSTGPPNAIRFVVESYQSETLYTNTSTAPLEMELYDLVLKKDLPQTWVYTLGSNTWPIPPKPESYWYNGSLIQSNKPTGTVIHDSPANQLGSSPFDSQLFTEFFEVRKRTIVTMSMGATHRHIVFMKPNYLVKDAEIQNNVLCNGVAGLTAFTMIRFNGFPTGSLDDANTATSGAQLSWVQSTRVKYTFATDVSQNMYQSNPVALTAPADIVNIGSGLVETQSFV